MSAKIYVCLMLLLVVGQMATSKSVDERSLTLNKRQAKQENKDAEDATTEAPTESSESDEIKAVTPLAVTTTTVKPSKARRQTAKAKTTTPIPTTPAEEDDEEETTTESTDDEEAPTVKPLSTEEKPKEKPKSPKKPKPTSPPKLFSRIKPDCDSDGPKPADEEPVNQKPVAGRPVNQPASNLLPPMPFNSYLPPLPNSFIPPQNPAAFAPMGFNPFPSPPPVFSGPYDYPRPSGPPFSNPNVAGVSGASASAGSFASASASAGGNGGTVSTSTNDGVNGVQQSSHSFSSSYPNGGTQQSSFIGSRGNFDDDESVAIEVDGPGATGLPAYSPNYAVSGPGYASSGAFSSSPYGNSIPSFGPYSSSSPVDFQQIFQQYFAAMQAQQLAFQQQLQAQIQAQQQAGGSFASSGAFITNDQGMVDPNAQVYVNTYTSPTSGSASTSVDSRSGLGGSKSTVVAYPFSNKNNDNRIWDQSNRVDSNFGAPAGAAGGSPSSGPQTAYASANIGPNGGYQTGQVSPASPGIFSRFGEDIPAPSGGQYGVFSSSSSSSHTGPDGQTVSRKSATVGVNDNGKVSYKTVHDP